MIVRYEQRAVRHDQQIDGAAEVLVVLDPARQERLDVYNLVVVPLARADACAGNDRGPEGARCRPDRAI
jgi:hypothetical protein